MDMTASTAFWAAGLGGAGGALSAWLARHRGAAAPRPPVAAATGDLPRGRVAQVGAAAVIAAGTAAGTAWMIGGAAASAALAFFWIGFMTAGWMAAERDKAVLHAAVCRAATAPAAHPDTVQALAHATPDAVFEAVKALVPRRVVR